LWCQWLTHGNPQATKPAGSLSGQAHHDYPDCSRIWPVLTAFKFWLLVQPGPGPDLHEAPATARQPRGSSYWQPSSPRAGFVHIRGQEPGGRMTSRPAAAVLGLWPRSRDRLVQSSTHWQARPLALTVSLPPVAVQSTGVTACRLEPSSDAGCSHSGRTRRGS
jgi:hypothetical protein